VNIALTRAVSASFADCELTHIERAPIDVTTARAQHAAYNAALRRAGCTIIEVPPAQDLPDAVFIEDTAVVVDEVAILARPGAAARRAELAAVEPELAGRRPLLRIVSPGTLDGGDVLRIGRTLYVGSSARTNANGIRQLQQLLARFGYDVRAVDVHGCLHLKTAVTALADDTLLANPAWIDMRPFSHMRVVLVAADEPFAANALRIGTTIVYPTGFPRTAERMAAAGAMPDLVDVSELAKAEGGVTCCSILLE
jgi:dimethylargininase